jgi:alkylation response protein AidB-like acyl-CoA dehydrogenase
MPVLSPSELHDLRRTCREVLDDVSPMSVTRTGATSALGYDSETWRNLADLGWLAALVPEQQGGLAWGFPEVAAILGELGRHCVPGPYVSTGVLAPTLLSRLTDADAADRLLGELATGEHTVAVALGTPAAVTNTVIARQQGGSWRLDGSVEGVLDLPHATVVLTSAMTDQGPGVFALDLSEHAGSVEAQPTVDQTRSLGTLRLEQADVAATAALAVGSAAAEAIAAAQESLYLAIACDAAAGARRVHELALGYSVERRQFGRVIGSFQAIKHRLADQYLLIECAEVSAHTAAEAMDRPGPEFAVSTAKAYATDAYCRVAHDAVLLHGAIGFTWEHDLHIYLKRALLDRELGGAPSWHRLRALGIRTGTGRTAAP